MFCAISSLRVTVLGAIGDRAIMHIILGVLGTVGAIAFFIYRLNLGMGAAREIGSEGQGLYRRYKWSKKNKNRPMDTITDPQQAVAVILVMLARERGTLTDRARKLSRLRSSASWRHRIREPLICWPRLNGLQEMPVRSIV